MTTTEEKSTREYVPPIVPDMNDFVTVTVASSVLQQAVTKILPVITTNPILPILEGIRVEYSDSWLHLRGSNLQTEINVDVSVQAVNPAPGLCCMIPARSVATLLTNLSEQPVNLFLSQSTFRIETMDENGRYEWSGLDNPIDFPATMMKGFTPQSQFSLPGDELKSILSTTTSYTCKDDLRPAMTGVLWKVDSGRAGHEIVATDGHRLVLLRPDIAEMPPAFSALIHRESALSLLKSLPAKIGSVSVSVGAAHIKFAWGAIVIYSRLIDERFPDYPHAIPSSHTSTVVLNRADMIAALRRSLVFSNRVTHQFKMSVDSKLATLVIESENLDYVSSMRERAVPLSVSGNSVVIGFNAKNLLNSLLGMKSASVEMRLLASNRAMVMFPIVENVADERALHLVMPVTI